MERRFDSKKTRRVAIKVGSRIICNDQGLAFDRLRALSGQMDLLRRRGMELIVVSSGAVAAGKKKMKDARGGPATLIKKQALAAIGQVHLMAAWDKAFSAHDVKVAQILLTAEDLADRHRFIHAKNTLSALLEMSVVPVVNENDTIATEELKFGDNDALGGLVASMAEADIFINLTDLDGLYESDPRRNPAAALIKVVEKVTPALLAQAGKDAGTPLGTGGMHSKVKAAGRLAERGLPSLIANGLTRDVLPRLMDGEELGTFFKPSLKPRGAKKHWLAFAARPKGKLTIDRGAAEALRDQGKSLLPKGIRETEGVFLAGDPVTIATPEGDGPGGELGVGLVNYPSAELRRIMGRGSREIPGILGFCHSEEAIHRDNLAIFDDGRDREDAKDGSAAG
ncbi:MAG: glutamate 5-kinase [Deltaproteobacteria bacterium]|jgi:glutamate 5-kinase|nr:glutamate 5-kinase [Deltaproteobacteria bacterium]